MFKVIPYRDLMNHDSEKRKKIKGFIIECGYSCNNSCWCPHGNKCRYKSKYRWHNFSVSVSRFFELHLHIRFHFPVYFQKHSVDLSGTTKCPHQVPRMYTCHDCEYSRGYSGCGNEVRHAMIKNGKYSEIEYPIDDFVHSRVCKLFKHNEYCQLYDKNTGEYLR